MALQYQESELKTKRSKIVIETEESRALRAMREFRQWSVRDVGDAMSVSHSLVYQYESGRADVTNSYVETFLNALSFSKYDWEMFKNKGESLEKIRLSCFEIIYGMTPENIIKLKNFLDGFKSVFFLCAGKYIFDVGI